MSLKDLVKASPYAPKMRQALSGAQFLFSDTLGSLPIRAVRNALAKKVLGITLADSAQLYRWREIRAGRNISIGDNTVVGLWSSLDGRSGITIGDHVNISSEVAIWTLQHDHRDPEFGNVGAPVVVGDRAWLSFRSTILPGVTIGEGAVVAAGSVVTKDVAPYMIVGGIPAKVIGQRNQELTYDWSAAKSGAPWFI
ncbi:acetyltransferase-like isoleucine patch superfamily enzyme [Arthrobacter sp. UYNi723]